MRRTSDEGILINHLPRLIYTLHECVILVIKQSHIEHESRSIIIIRNLN